MFLGVGQKVTPAGDDLDRRADRRVHRVARAERVGAETRAGADASRLRAAVAQREDDGVGGQTGLDMDRPLDGAARQAHPTDRSHLFAEFEISTLGARHLDQGARRHNAQRGSQARRDEDGIIPCEPGHRVGAFLQPTVVGETTVVRFVVGDETHLEAGRSDGWQPGEGSQNVGHSRGTGLEPGHGRRSGVFQQPVVQETPERLLRIAARELGDGLIDERVRIGHRITRQAREQDEFAHAVEERQNHRLDRHDGAVGRPRIAPRLKEMGAGEVHAGLRRRLVHLIPVTDHIRNGSLQGGPVEVGRGVVNRVAADDDERLHRPGLDGGSQVPQRGGAARFRDDKIDRPADGAERRVHQVRERVHGGRLVGAGNNQALPGVCQQISGTFGNPLRFDVDPLGERSVVSGAEDTAGQGGRQCRHVAARHPQTVVGHRTSNRETALGDVQPVHPAGVGGRRHAAAPGEGTRVGERGRVGVQEIAVQANNPPRSIEVVKRFDVVPKGHAPGLHRRLVGDGFEFGPHDSRQLLLEPCDQRSPRWRTRRFGEEGQPGALRGSVSPVDVSQQIMDRASGKSRAAFQVHRSPIRIVQVQHRGLSDETAGTALWLVGRVALQLGRAALVSLCDQRDGGAPQRHGRGKIQRQPVLHLFNGSPVGQNVGLRPPAAGQPDAAEGERRGHQLEKLPAVNPVEL